MFFFVFRFFLLGKQDGNKDAQGDDNKKEEVCVYVCVCVCAPVCVCERERESERESINYLQEIISIIFLIRMYLCTSCYHSRILVTVIIRIRYFISYFQYIRYSHILLTYFHYIRYFEC